MSQTSRERENPPTRRKSCGACIKAKRRCDGAVPICLRCGDRGLTCHYPLRKTRGTTSSKDSPELRPQEGGGEDPSHPLGFLDAALTDNTAASLLADIDENFPGSGSSLDFCLDPASLSQRSTNQNMTVFPLPGHPLGTSVADIAARQLRYGLAETQRALTTMAKEMQTPWSHPLLYQDIMPKSIRDAHASCALYSMKTSSNGPAILRSVESYVEELLQSDPPPTLRDRLAHTQALVLYHIIRLLDGDIRARGSAERQLVTLEESAFNLLSYINFDDYASKDDLVLPLRPIGPAKAFWHDWILHESARRTFLFSLFLLQSYRLLSGLGPPHCDARFHLCRALTVSMRLWSSETAVAFAEAWNERRFFIITNCSFDSVMRDGKAEDVDAFAKILMCSSMGIDEVEEWFVARGSSLSGE